MDLDPLCYNDDISLLLLGSKKLRELKMHWSPRMRREAEPSTSLQTYLGRCIAAGYVVPLQHVSLQNFYGPNHGHMHMAFDKKTVVDSHYIDIFGGSKGASSNVFIDATWKKVPREPMHWKVHRVNEIALQHTRIMSSFTGCEELYFVNAREPPPTTPSSDMGKTPGASRASASPLTPFQTPPANEYEGASLGKEYMHIITTNHGATLRNLLLSDQWAIEADQMAHLVRSCPNLEQLGIALGGTSPEIFRMLVPFLPKLYAIRLLANDWLLNDPRASTINCLEPEASETIRHEMGREAYKTDCKKLTWVGVGDRVMKMGKEIEVGNEETGELEWIREITVKTKEDVRHVRIWSMDSLEI